MTVVILAGGQSRRMGQDKMCLPVSGETMLLRLYRRYRAVFPRVRVSVADESRYPELGDARIFDRFPGLGPLAGLHAALAETGDDVFLTAGDMPYSDPEKAAALVSLCKEHEACVLLDGEGRREPLFGFYRASLAERAEQRLKEGRRGMVDFLRSLRVREVTLAELGEGADSPLLRNVNEPGDYKKLRLELGE